MTTRDLLLLLITAGSVVGLIVLIARFKLPSFIALILASLGVGLCSGADPLDTTRRQNLAAAPGLGCRSARKAGNWLRYGRHYHRFRLVGAHRGHDLGP